eukprot:11194047-Lingulodinium_polyedra.AAC.1
MNCKNCPLPSQRGVAIAERHVFCVHVENDNCERRGKHATCNHKRAKLQNIGCKIMATTEERVCRA